MSAISELLVHPKSQKQAIKFIKSPPSSILILGNPGSGKLKFAQALAQQLLKTDNLENYPYFVHVRKPEDRSEISIEASRQITRFLRLKTPGSGDIKRVILIEDAHFMSDEAQNSLLKIIEEPNDDTVFILTATQTSSLLSTIISRCQLLQLPPVSLRQASEYFKKEPQLKLNSAWQLSQGEPELLEALLKDQEEHPLKQAVEKAKSFLNLPKYERLLMLDEMSKNKETLALFLDALSKVLAAIHHAAVSRGQQSQANNILKDRQIVRSCIEAIELNGNLRLITLTLILSLNN
jgi:hypothetical protein